MPVEQGKDLKNIFFFLSNSRPVANKVILNTNSKNIQISEMNIARNVYIMSSSHQNIKCITYKIMLSKVYQIHSCTKKSSLILSSTKQLQILSYSASRFNFEGKM